MSLLFDTEEGSFVSSEQYFNSIMQTTEKPPKINPNLFKILSPYSTKNIKAKRMRNPGKKRDPDQDDAPAIDFCHLQNEIKRIQDVYSRLLVELRMKGFLQAPTETFATNTESLKAADLVYEKTGENLVRNALGSNTGPPIIKTIQNTKFLFPNDCIFFSKDVKELGSHLRGRKFDLILLDPPWWNKYIRRKRKKCPHAYDMMYDEDLKNIPIETLLNDNGLVVVWCTNSPQHLKALTEEIFAKWRVGYVCKWFWLKVTLCGETVCKFAKPPGKQPFEQIIFGSNNLQGNNLPPDGKLVVSIPSAIHSHKPPLGEVLKTYLPHKPQCLEIFARYLLPHWTSYGNEVLRFQHESLYAFQE